eukprot:989847-Prymnesium_polylepis.1
MQWPRGYLTYGRYEDTRDGHVVTHAYGRYEVTYAYGRYEDTHEPTGGGRREPGERTKPTSEMRAGQSACAGCSHAGQSVRRLLSSARAVARHSPPSS